jgi:hypothetical protein
VAQKSLETARALREQTRRSSRSVVVSKVEVTEADAGVSQREVERIRTENQYRNQQDVLIDLVLGPNLRASSTLEIRPTDRPDDFTPYDIDVEGAVSRAFEHRPELARATKEIERSEVQRAYARNQRLPALDGVFQLRTVRSRRRQERRACRFSSTPAACLVRPEPFPGDFDNSVDDYEDYPQYVAGRALSIPFPNTTARANARPQRSRALARADQQAPPRAADHHRRATGAPQSRGLAGGHPRRAQRARGGREQLRAEQVRLQYGESTPFDVLQREEALVARERDEIGAFRAYRTR